MKFRSDIIKRPQLRSRMDGDSERHADWLELLYDLVFVAAISLLAINLSYDYSFSNFLKSIPLFFVIWWGWVGHTFYLSRFGADDVLHRILTMGQMVAVASLAVNVKGALGPNGAGFALSYAFLRFMLIAEYFRAGRHIPEAKQLTNHYCIGFSAAAILWVISAFIPDPWRYILWGVALIVDLLTPITAGEEHIKIPPHATHLPERFGLFTIILIGEAVVSIVFRMSDLGFTLSTEITGILALIIAFSFWWGYFEESKGAETRVQKKEGDIGKYQLWLYSHFPLLLGITATAAGIKHLISNSFFNFIPPLEVWLLCISIDITFISLSLIYLSSFTMEQCKNKFLQIFRLPYYIIIFSVILIGFLGSILPGSIILMILTTLCVLKVILSLREFPPEILCKIED